MTDSEAKTNIAPITQTGVVAFTTTHWSVVLAAQGPWVGKLTGQLAAARAEQVAALEDHSSDSEKRVERIGAAQIRERVLVADLEHERAPRTQLVSTLRDAAKRCSPLAQAVYLAERARRCADVLEELRSTLDPSIVHGLEQIEEPGHSDSARLRRWPSMLEFTSALHSSVRALDACRVDMPNFDSFSQIPNDEELSYLIASATGFLAAIAKLQAEI